MVDLQVKCSFCEQVRKHYSQPRKVLPFLKRRAAGIPFYCSQPCAEAAGIKTTGREPGVSREERETRNNNDGCAVANRGNATIILQDEDQACGCERCRKDGEECRNCPDCNPDSHLSKNPIRSKTILDQGEEDAGLNGPVPDQQPNKKVVS